MPSPNGITTARAVRPTDRPDTPILVDSCLDENFAPDPTVPPGAFHHSHEDVADVGRGADTGCPDRAPKAAGPLAVSLGPSRLHRDDLEQLEAGPVV